MALELASGSEFSFRRPKGNDDPGDRRFVFAMHKSGSVLLNRIIDDLADVAGVPVFNFPELLFRKGIQFQDIEKAPADLFTAGGIIYAGFRNIPKDPCRLDLDRGGKAIFMVRDPRDILVSLYFSMKHSHSIPQSGSAREKLLEIRENMESVSVDDYARKGARRIRRRLRKFRKNLLRNDHIDARVFRYEDVIFEKEKWVADIAGFLDLEVPGSEIAAIAERHDRRPEKEDPTSHIRRVSPGDFREKLSEETIEYLSSELDRITRSFGYDLTGRDR